ncbi:hypothetical protein D3C86_1364310 [compost metagenome]
MRTLAELVELTLPIHFDVLVFRNLIQQFDLEGLSCVMLADKITRNNLAVEATLFRNDTAHLFLNQGKVSFGDRVVPTMKVVEEAVFGCRASTQQGARIQIENSFSQNVSHTVTHNLERTRIITLEECDG